MFSQACRPSRRIKIVVTGGLGDCLLATPFIRNFKQSGRYDEVWCAAPEAAGQIFDSNPFIDRFIPCAGSDLLVWAVPEEDWDVFSPYIEAASPDTHGAGMTIPMRHIFRPNRVAKPVVQQVAEFHRIVLTDETPEIFITADDHAWANQTMAAVGDRRGLFFNPASRLPEKDLPAGLAQQIVDRLKQQFYIFQLPGPSEADGVFTLSPFPTVRQVAALFARIDGVLTVDSFPGHLATAMGTPAVVLFGPSNSETFGHPENENISAKVCPPCADTPRRKVCRKYRCMDAMPISDIVAATTRLRNREKPNVASI